MNLQGTLYNPFCSLLLCDRHLPPRSKPVYGTVVLPVAPIPTNLDSRPSFFSAAHRKELWSRQSLHIEKSALLDKTGLISFLLLILLPLYFYILLGYLIPSTCHPNEPLFEKAKNS